LYAIKRIVLLFFFAIKIFDIFIISLKMYIYNRDVLSLFFFFCIVRMKNLFRAIQNDVPRIGQRQE